MKGQVVGMNVTIFSQAGQFYRVRFVIPSIPLLRKCKYS